VLGIVLSWYCRGIVCIYIWKMGKNGEKKLTLAYLVLVVGVELCLVVC